jgi:hypothetical protein
MRPTRKSPGPDRGRPSGRGAPAGLPARSPAESARPRPGRPSAHGPAPRAVRRRIRVPSPRANRRRRGSSPGLSRAPNDRPTRGPLFRPPRSRTAPRRAGPPCRGVRAGASLRPPGAGTGGGERAAGSLSFWFRSLPFRPLRPSARMIVRASEGNQGTRFSDGREEAARTGLGPAGGVPVSAHNHPRR